MPTPNQRVILGYVALDILLFLPMIALLLVGRYPLLWLAVPVMMGGFFLALSSLLKTTGLGSVSEVGLRLHPNWSRNLLLGAALAVIYLLGLYSVRWLFAGFRVTASIPFREFLLPQLAVAATWFVAAVQEELLMRGYLLTHLMRRFARPIAILLSSIVFVLHHYNHWLGGPGIWMAQVFLHGLLFAIPAVRTRSLWFSIGFHWAWNAGGTLLEGFLSVPGVVATVLANPGISQWLEAIGDVVVLLIVLSIVPFLSQDQAKRHRQTGWLNAVGDDRFEPPVT